MSASWKWIRSSEAKASWKALLSSHFAEWLLCNMCQFDYWCNFGWMDINQRETLNCSILLQNVPNISSLWGLRQWKSNDKMELEVLNLFSCRIDSSSDGDPCPTGSVVRERKRGGRGKSFHVTLHFKEQNIREDIAWNRYFFKTVSVSYPILLSQKPNIWT